MSIQIARIMIKTAIYKALAELKREFNEEALLVEREIVEWTLDFGEKKATVELKRTGEKEFSVEVNF